MTAGEKKVILASSLGTVFEWYDFFLYGSLATVIGAQFFSAYPEATRNIFALLAFAAGFIVRPFGALVFGRLGDLVGRKHTFLVTILIMGLSTFAVGLLPSYSTMNAYGVGWIAPVTLLVLRMLQGLALGGEYGGAAVYVAEHAPTGRRGFYTSFIQATATLGLLLSLIIILSTQGYVNNAYPATTITNADGSTSTLTAFQVWGWRIPFLVSVALLAISVWIRLQMSESPAFKKMKEEGTHSKAPLSEAFGQWKNAKWALLALLGLTAGQAVVWYTGQFYALFFLQSILKVDQFTANVMVAWSLIAVTGGFLVFGALSDKIGRKPIILGGCLLAALTYFPLFNMLTASANPALHAAQSTVPVVVKTNTDDCSFQFNPVGTAKFTKECDVAKALLARSAVNYTTEYQPAGTPTVVTVKGKDFPVADPTFSKSITAALTEAGYPSATANPTVIKAAHPLDIFTGQKLAVIGILFILAVYVTMVYGPIAAALVELFPTRIRYTSMSLPYHIGNGWFGGLLPATAFAMVAQTGDIYYGLWYPIVIALFTFVVGLIFIPETKDRDLMA
ncbi:MFS family permease [Methylobacterium aerolatum]|uniref:MFS family permease n=2 Tax=Methylobacterium aerolatum TaxID=418708 RepID=A0ABU0HTS5_9HYPH|nr:MFS family permease [Methylobacterium aerolatum]